MEHNPELSIEITNRTGHDVYVNAETLQPDDTKAYSLNLPSVRITHTNSDMIKIDLSGEEQEKWSGNEGMCLCLSKGNSIMLTLSHSMNITVKKGSPDLDEGVGCGETND